MIKKVEYWEVSDNFSDDGRHPGSHKVIGTFSNLSAAEEYSEGRGNYGNKAGVQEKTLVISDTVEDQEQANDDVDREAALRKLTPHQQELLGLTKEKST